MAEPLRVVVLRDGGVYVAQCLEIDIAAQGLTEEEALDRLYETYRAEENLAREEGRNVHDIGPAPSQFHVLFSSEVVGRTEMKKVA